jgi:hypothetical protein
VGSITAKTKRFCRKTFIKDDKEYRNVHSNRDESEGSDISERKYSFFSFVTSFLN